MWCGGRSKKDRFISFQELLPRITVKDPVTHDSWDKGKFTTYLICIKTEHPSFHLRLSAVRRRFSELRWLYKMVKANHPHIHFPKAPSKKVFAERFEPEFINSRMGEIQEFLNQLLVTDTVLSDAAFHFFVQTDLTPEEIEEHLNGTLSETIIQEAWENAGHLHSSSYIVNTTTIPHEPQEISMNEEDLQAAAHQTNCSFNSLDSDSCFFNSASSVHDSNGALTVLSEDSSALSLSEDNGAIIVTEDNDAIIVTEDNGAIILTKDNGALSVPKDNGVLSLTEDKSAHSMPEDSSTLSVPEDNCALSVSETYNALSEANNALSEANNALSTADSNDALSVANNALSEANNALSETNNALSETNNALSETNNALSETNNALSETNNALSETNNALSETNNALSTADSNDALSETNNALSTADSNDALPVPGIRGVIFATPPTSASSSDGPIGLTNQNEVVSSSTDAMPSGDDMPEQW